MPSKKSHRGNIINRMRDMNLVATSKAWHMFNDRELRAVSFREAKRKINRPFRNKPTSADVLLRSVVLQSLPEPEEAVRLLFSDFLLRRIPVEPLLLK